MESVENVRDLQESHLHELEETSSTVVLNLLLPLMPTFQRSFMMFRCIRAAWNSLLEDTPKVTDRFRLDPEICHSISDTGQSPSISGLQSYM